MSLESLIRGSNLITKVTLAPKQYLNNILSVNTYGKPNLDQKELMGQLRNATESREVRQMYLKDINSRFGRALDKVLDIRGYKKKMPDHYTYLDMPEQVMAATITAENGKVILAYNIKHAAKLRSNKLLRKYVNLHEHGHVRGEHSESSTEGLVRDAANAVIGKFQDFYRWSRRAREIVNNALAIGQYAAAREAAQYGK